jgi:hypothetical protein
MCLKGTGKPERRSTVHHVRVSESERGFIFMLSDVAGMKPGDYIRARCLTPPRLTAGAPSRGACGRLHELSARLNPLMKLANSSPKRRADAVRESVALLSEFGAGGWPAGRDATALPAETGRGKPARKGGGGGKGRGGAEEGVKTVSVSVPGFCAELSSFRREGARAEAVARMGDRRRDIEGVVLDGMSFGAVAACVNGSSAMKYGGAGGGVTAGDVERLFAGDGGTGRGFGRIVRGGRRAVRRGRQARGMRIFLAVNGGEAAAFGRFRRMSGMTMAAYARSCCLGGPPPAVPPANVRAYVRLSRLASNLTQLRNHVGRPRNPLVESAQRSVFSFRTGLLGMELDS